MAYYKPPFDKDGLEYSGSCSSRKPFFAAVDGDIRDTSEVNEDNVRTTAMTECFKKAVFTACGMRNPTAEQLDKLGVDTSQSGTVDFTKGKKSTKSADTGDEKSKRDDIARMTREMFENNYAGDDGKAFDNADDVLKAITKSTYKDSAGNEKTFAGWAAPGKISQKALNITYKKVKDEYEAFTGGGDK